jgi:putative NADH-flavin reductase
MKLIIFGSTGSVGRQLVELALAEGHAVTAFARDPAKLNIKHANLKIVQGDVLDFASVEKAVQGQDAVLSAIGAGAQGTIRSEGTRHIVRAMESAGIRRFISLSTLGIGDTWKMLPLKYKVLFSTLLRKAFADHEAQEDCIKKSQLEWTIVRPGEYIAGGRTGKYRHGFPPTGEKFKAQISHADVADFMLKQVTDRTYLGQTPSLSY